MATQRRSCTATRISVALALWVAVAGEANRWSQLSPSGTAPAVRSSHTSVWSDVADGMYVFGGYLVGRGNFLNDLHFFDRQARSGHTSVWSDVADGMYVFGGWDGSKYVNDLHFFDRQANRWSQLSPSGMAPRARNSHTSVWCDVADGMYVFGGYDSNLLNINDLHFFDRQANRWSQLSPSGTAPAARKGHTSVWSDVADGMYVFGGVGRNFLNDLHFFDRQANRWSQLSPSGTAPAARGWHTSVWSDVADGMYVFGGWDGGKPLNDLHFYDRQTTIPKTTAAAATTATTSQTSLTTTPIVTQTQESCQLITCKLGYIRRNASSGSIAAETTCCEESCHLFACPPRYTHKSTSLMIVGKISACCEKSCALFICEGTKKISFSSTIPGTSSNCCESTTLSPVESGDQDESWLIWIGVVAAVVGALGLALVMLWRWQSRKKDGYLPSNGLEASQRSEGSMSSFPAIVPVVPTPEVGPSHVKPLLFAWDARMTAEWPRGKVLRLVVKEDSFDANGHQYQFHGDREFVWGDGTIQTLESVDRNVASWSTNHERSEWCRFRWICTPQVVPGHDMTLTETDSEQKEYRCHSCRCGFSERHWHSAEYQVHLCPNCAELPPEVPTLGVAARYLVDFFPDLARSASGKENPNFYEICPTVAHGNNGLGFQKTCPRDGKPHCSIVDALNETCTGRVTHFVSWCWSYRLMDFVSAVNGWVRKSGVDGEDVFLWICFFCNNQYRILQEATQTGADELKSVFESHLVEAGHMLVLLDTIEQPAYAKRAWCIFESYVCIEQQLPMTIILPSSAESFFKETVESGGIGVLRNAVNSLDVRDAKASAPADEDLIKRLILTTIGFDRVNAAVKLRLRQQLINLFDQLLNPSPR
eukprot:symbB.v1.2.018488.t1/scaffold1477.1/size133841/2